MQLDRMDVIYVGIDNPITLAVEGYSNDSIFLTARNCTITGGKGHFIINPTLPTTYIPVDVMLKTDTGIRKLGYRTFRAKCPEATAGVGIMGKRAGKISLSYVRKAIGPTAWYEGFEYDSHIIITKATIVISRNNEVLFDKTLHNGGGVRFADDEETKNAIQSLQPGDHLLLDNMTYSPSTNCHSSLQQINLIIVE